MFFNSVNQWLLYFLPRFNIVAYYPCRIQRAGRRETLGRASNPTPLLEAFWGRRRQAQYDC